MSDRLVYFGGVGKSGTTLMGRLLGAHPDAVTLGELVRLPQAVRNGESCSCGAPVSQCDDFWLPVLGRAFPRHTIDDLAAAAGSVAAVERHRNIPRTLAGGAEARRYALFVASLLGAVREHTGASVLIDTSKRLGPATVLARSRRFDLTVVHVVRDPRAVVSAWISESVDVDGVSPLRSAVVESLRWEAVDRALAGLRYAGVDVLTTGFEDLLEDPAETLAAVCERAGLDPVGLEPVVGSGKVTFTTDHVIGGDDIRHHVGEAELRSEDEWRYQLGSLPTRAASAITRRGRRRYGLSDVADLGPIEPVSRPDSTPDRPGVSVVVATHGRPELVRKTIDAIVTQRYAGAVEVVVVHDNEPRDPDLPRETTTDGNVRVVRSINNRRQQGLAGARNSGIAETAHGLVAFCDDDDTWFPGKLARQVDRLNESGCRAVVCGIEIEFDGIFTSRVPAMDVIEMHHLLRSRIVEAHPSGYLFTKALLDEVGPVDESLAGSYAEDYELLLRIARQEPIATVREPLIRVLWGRTSFFNEGWRNRIEALSAVLDEFPEFADDPRGAARIQGQISFAYASMDQPDEAKRWARRALASDPTQPRVLLAGAVASGAVGSSTVIKMLQSTGRGV